MNFSKQLKQTMDEWTRDRVRALTAIDRHEWPVARGEIIRWFQMTKTEIPSNDDALLVAVHKMRVSATDMPDDVRLASVKWLRERGVDL